MNPLAQVDLNDLMYFAKVVETGGFAAAGRALGIPKSRLSRRVAALETSLDVRLLQRTTRKLSLTEIGARYVEHCKAVLEAAQLAHETVTHARATPSGLLRLSAPVALVDRYLAPLLPRFALQYPDVRLDVVAINRKVDLVAEGVDVALRVRFASEFDPNLVTRRLFEGVSWPVATPAFLRGGRAIAVPSDLSAHALLGFADDDRLLHWDFMRGTETAAIVATPHMASNSFVVLREAALAGLGIAFIPVSFCGDDVRAGTLVRVLPDWDLPNYIAHLVYPTRKGLSPAVRALVDFLVEAMSPAQSGNK
jgi:DNA-binding transcriptional LysR family regulator